MSAIRKSVALVLFLVQIQAKHSLSGQAVLSPEFLVDKPVPVPVGGVQPAVCQFQDGFLAVWNGAGTRLSGSGQPLDLPAFRLNGDLATWYPSVAWNGQSALVVWEDRRNATSGTNPADVYGALISPSGVVSPGFAITTLGKGHVNPKVAASGDSFLVVWEDWRDGSPKIYGTTVSPQGKPAQTNGVLIGNSTNIQVSPPCCGKRLGVSSSVGREGWTYPKRGKWMPRQSGWYLC